VQVIGAGYPRTGTLSTQAALIRLGLPCYHMAEVVRHEAHTDAWYDFLVQGRPMDWRRLFADYEATVDAPAAFFHREIMEAFPAAKVLLNLRDSEKWFESFMTLNGVMMEFAARRGSNPRLDRWLAVGEALIGHTFGGTLDRDSIIRVFEEHNRRVQEEVPAHRLLVFRVQDGWEPLCAFLGRDVPAEPFPHLNEGPDTIRTMVGGFFGIA
jgi:hypothetical protein